MCLPRDVSNPTGMLSLGHIIEVTKRERVPTQRGTNDLETGIATGVWELSLLELVGQPQEDSGNPPLSLRHT